MSNTKAAASAGKAGQAANSRKSAWLEPHQFKAGQSGNPKGRPKSVITDALRKALRDNPELAGKIALSQLKQAAHGDSRAFQAVTDRLEGKAHQQIDLAAAMTVNVIVDL